MCLDFTEKAEIKPVRHPVRKWCIKMTHFTEKEPKLSPLDIRYVNGVLRFHREEFGVFIRFYQDDPFD